jgi:hypothetical protein
LFVLFECCLVFCFVRGFCEIEFVGYGLSSTRGCSRVRRAMGG